MKRSALFYCCIWYWAHYMHSNLNNVEPGKRPKEMNGYSIRLKMAPGNTVLFDLLKDQHPVFNHSMNPVTMLPQGFASKADAYKVAEWMIGKYGAQGHFPPMLPPGVAKQLNVANSFPKPLPVN